MPPKSDGATIIFALISEYEQLQRILLRFQKQANVTLKGAHVRENPSGILVLTVTSFSKLVSTLYCIIFNVVKNVGRIFHYFFG